MDVISGWIGSVTKKVEELKPSSGEGSVKPNENDTVVAESKEQEEIPKKVNILFRGFFFYHIL